MFESNNNNFVLTFNETEIETPPMIILPVYIPVLLVPTKVTVISFVSPAFKVNSVTGILYFGLNLAD